MKKSKKKKRWIKKECNIINTNRKCNDIIKEEKRKKNKNEWIKKENNQNGKKERRQKGRKEKEVNNWIRKQN